MSFIRTIKYKLSQLERKFKYLKFNYEVKACRQFPPLREDPDKLVKGLCVVSMSCKRDFYQYILAIYSFCQYIQPEKIVVVNDGSLEADDIAEMQSLIPSLEIVDGNLYVDERLPKFNCWQRIQTIAEYVEKYYVIQLDADILVVDDINEVRDAVIKNQPFILGTDTGQEIVTIDKSIKYAEQRKAQGIFHLQIEAECNLDVLGEKAKYIRGCAGFAGYPQKSFDMNRLIEISDVFRHRLGNTWDLWGSEQVTSNVLLANEPRSVVLPLTSYDSVDNYSNKLKLIHFLGTYRFSKGLYAKLSKQFITDYNG